MMCSENYNKFFNFRFKVIPFVFIKYLESLQKCVRKFVGKGKSKQVR